MNRVDKRAYRFSSRIEFDDAGYIQNAQEIRNSIFENVCEEFSDSLPSDNLIGSSNDDFNESNIGEWGGRENKAARTMQTIYNLAYQLAQIQSLRRNKNDLL